MAPDATEPALVPAPGSVLAELGVNGPDAPASSEVLGASRVAVVVSGVAEGSRPELRIYQADKRGLTLEAAVAFPPGATSGATLPPVVWQSATQPVILFDDGSLATVSEGKLVPLARPPAALFEVPDPRPALGAEMLGVPLAPSDVGLIATERGEVWIDHCAWNVAGEPSHCETHVFVRVGSSPIAVGSRPPERPAPPPLAAPAGWSISGAPAQLICGGPDRAPRPLERTSPHEDCGVRLDGWLSQRPAIATWADGYPGMDTCGYTGRLVARCEPVPAADGVWIARGPNGFWAIESQLEGARGNLVVLWHGRILGQLEGDSSLYFAPPQ